MVWNESGNRTTDGEKKGTGGLWGEIWEDAHATRVQAKE